MTPIDSPPALPQKVTSCQRVRDATRRIRTFAIVTAHRAVFAALICAAPQSTIFLLAISIFSDLTRTDGCVPFASRPEDRC